MYYDQCYAVAKPVVQHWFTDVTKHDKPALTDYAGDIIYALRETGTNLILLNDEITRRQAEWLEAFTFTPNQHFFIGRKGKLKSVTKECAFNAWIKYRKQQRI